METEKTIVLSLRRAQWPSPQLCAHSFFSTLLTGLEGQTLNMKPHRSTQQYGPGKVSRISGQASLSTFKRVLERCIVLVPGGKSKYSGQEKQSKHVSQYQYVSFPGAIITLWQSLLRTIVADPLSTGQVSGLELQVAEWVGPRAIL